MPVQIGTRIAGPLTRLNCTSVASATNASVAAFGNEIAAWAEFLNTGAYPIVVVVGPTATGLPAPTVPASLASATQGANDRSVSEFILPASMEAPITHAVPTGLVNSNKGFWFNGIAVGATGTQSGDIWVTPVVAQS